MSAKRRKLLPQRTAMMLGLKELVGWRCEFCREAKCWPLDGHEVLKPRSKYWLNPNYVVVLGRPHHDMAEAAYGSKTGRLEIPGTRSTGWGFYVQYGASKASVRAATPLLASGTNRMNCPPGGGDNSLHTRDSRASGLGTV